MKEQVYFISYEEGPIKIGKAVNVMNRLRTLQTSLPHKLVCIGVQVGERGLERKLHDQFGPLRVSGEWFRREPSILEYIQTHARPYCDKSERKIQENNAHDPSQIALNNMKARLEDVQLRKAKKDMFESLSDLVEQAMWKWVLTAKEMLIALDQIEGHIRERHGDVCEFHPLELRVRKIVDTAIDTKNWHDGDDVLHGDIKETRRKVKSFARRWTKRHVRMFFDLLD
jgi:hypothetical protein